MSRALAPVPAVRQPPLPAFVTTRPSLGSRPTPTPTLKYSAYPGQTDAAIASYLASIGFVSINLDYQYWGLTPPSILEQELVENRPVLVHGHPRRSGQLINLTAHAIEAAATL